MTTTKQLAKQIADEIELHAMAEVAQQHPSHRAVAMIMRADDIAAGHGEPQGVSQAFFNRYRQRIADGLRRESRHYE